MVVNLRMKHLFEFSKLSKYLYYFSGLNMKLILVDSEEIQIPTMPFSLKKNQSFFKVHRVAITEYNPKSVL